MQRILALVMAILLLVSVFATLIYYLVTPLFAAESNEITKTVKLPSGDDKIVTVGLMFANGVTNGFETKADYGFEIKKVNCNGDYSAELLWTLENTKVSCTVDHNLSKAAMTYTKTSSADNTVIGGWHAEISGDYSLSEMVILTEAVDDALSEYGYYSIPSYIDGQYRIRVGHFATDVAAVSCLSVLETAFPGFNISLVGPSETGVSVLDPDTDKILFEYDDKNATALGLEPLDSPEGEEAYLVTPAKNKYDGIFMFRRNFKEYIDGVAVTNVITLGDYTKGVVPYEIGNKWHIESQKALAVCVRSHLLYTSKHSTFDACNNSACCQQYKGVNNVNDQVIKAVDDTAGEVIAYDGKGVCAYFSAVTGGCTVGNYEGFGGGAKPYLAAVDTPWEIYTNHTYGVWTVEISPTKLLETIRKKDGFSHLSGSIASIKTTPAENSTYVGEITFTDIYGNKATKKNNVYAFLYSIGIRSANFVVGKGSVIGEETTFTVIPPTNPLPENPPPPTGESDTPSTPTVITSKGVLSINDKKPAYVLTAKGMSLTIPAASAPAAPKDDETTESDGRYGETVVTTKPVAIHAKDSNNFIFYGKGWGHGVGASQVGMRDLANLGYGYEEILKKYFTDIEIIDWRESR